jgi:hypothetical protein
MIVQLSRRRLVVSMFRSISAAPLNADALPHAPHQDNQ